MDASIEHKKIALIQWLSTLDDPSVIERIMELRESEQQDWWRDITTEERVSVEKGLQDAKAGKLTSHTEVRKRYGHWL